jgi:primosomal protein N' (replication factor Y)
MNFVELVFSLPIQKSFTYETEVLLSVGMRVQAMFGRRKLIGIVVAAHTKKPDFPTKKILKNLDDEPLASESQIAMARWISQRYFCSLGEALHGMLPSGKQESVKHLMEEDLGDLKSIELSEEQQMAIKTIVQRPDGWFYLHGITGSGKTEVYLNAAQEYIARGKSVLYLVPEIALTHQLLIEVKKRFGEAVSILHSGLTPSQKLHEWRKCTKAHLVLGARSAVFAPMENLGLIIIDEEHESSYKSGNSPRYHARQVAMKRAKELDAGLILGSATPSLEAWEASRRGIFEKIELKTRPAGGANPVVRIIDIRKETGVIGKELFNSMRQTLDEGRQVILFLNRRGFQYFFHCNNCSYQMICPHCSVSMTYHKNPERMVCHYCGKVERPVTSCPDCGSLDVGFSGFGTAMVEEEVQRLFPQQSIARLDSDVVSKKGVLKKTISDFKNRKIDILLGTQMVAKGLNFPGVKLVGIVLADTGLQMPDFRAEERIFSLLTQVSGRAGRYSDDGEVIIQTFSPENPAITASAAGELELFYDQELENRRDLGFPPFSRLIRLVFRAKSLHLVEKTADAAASLLRGKCSFFGPSPCALEKISENFRYQILLRSGDFASIHQVLADMLQKLEVPNKLYVEIDPDPNSLL